MNNEKEHNAARRLSQFRQWLAATGALPRGSSWIGELEAIVVGRGEDDAAPTASDAGTIDTINTSDFCELVAACRPYGQEGVQAHKRLVAHIDQHVAAAVDALKNQIALADGTIESRSREIELLRADLAKLRSTAGVGEDAYREGYTAGRVYEQKIMAEVRAATAPVSATPTAGDDWKSQQRRIKYLETLVDAYGPKSYQYDIEHPNDGLNAPSATLPPSAGAPVLTLAEVWAAIDGNPDHLPSDPSEVLEVLRITAMAADECDDKHSHQGAPVSAAEQAKCKTCYDVGLIGGNSLDPLDELRFCPDCPKLAAPADGEELPALPMPVLHHVPVAPGLVRNGYSDEQMRQYARAALAMRQPQGASFDDAMEFAARTLELYDDATMLGDYMIDSKDAAAILRAMKGSAVVSVIAAKQAGKEGA